MRLIHLSLKDSPLDAVFLNGQVILGAEVSTGVVQVVAENLASTLHIPVETLSGVTPPMSGWDWDDALGLALWDVNEPVSDHNCPGQ